MRTLVRPASPARPLALLGALALSLLGAAPAAADSTAPSRLASARGGLAPGEAIEVDLAYRSDWTVLRYKDPLRIAARLTLEGAAAARGARGDARRLIARLETRLVEYERPGRRWSVAGGAALPPLDAISPAPPASGVVTEVHPYAWRLAAASESLGAAAAAARGVAFAVEVPRAGPARARAQGAPPLEGLPPGALRLLESFVASSTVFLFPRAGASGSISETPPRVLLSTDGRAEGMRSRSFRSLDGVRMHGAGARESTPLGPAEAYRREAQGEGVAPDAEPYSLLGALGVAPVLETRARGSTDGVAGLTIEEASDPVIGERIETRDPSDAFGLTLRYTLGFRSMNASGDMAFCEESGIAASRTLVLEEAMTASSGDHADARITLEARSAWSARVVATRRAEVAP
jgi:hypothetical protein